MTTTKIDRNGSATESLNVHDLARAVDNAETVLHAGIARGLIDAGGAFTVFRRDLARLFGEQRERAARGLGSEPATDLPLERLEAIAAAQELRDRFEFVGAALKSGSALDWHQCADELEASVREYARGLRGL